jgi:hypothetical protein
MSRWNTGHCASAAKFTFGLTARAAQSPKPMARAVSPGPFFGLEAIRKLGDMPAFLLESAVLARTICALPLDRLEVFHTLL